MTKEEFQTAKQQANGLPALQRFADIWFQAGRKSAIRDIIEEWEKPWSMTDGRRFIDRLRDMK